MPGVSLEMKTESTCTCVVMIAVLGLTAMLLAAPAMVSPIHEVLAVPVTRGFTGSGIGSVTCPGPGGFIINNLQISFGTDTFKGLKGGGWEIVIPFGFGDKSGTLSKVQASGNKYSLKGTETIDSLCPALVPPVFSPSVTIGGQCGAATPIEFAASNGEKGTFTGAFGGATC
jgi:hypothetical protein